MMTPVHQSRITQERCDQSLPKRSLSLSALNGSSDLQSAAQDSKSPNMCFESVIMCQSLDSSDHNNHTLSFSQVPLLTCIWMSGANGLRNQTAHMMVVELASFCLCIDFYVHPQVNPLSSFEMNILSKFININIHRCTHRCIPT